MSDDLTPAEQARAHRLSAQALYERNPTAFEASRYALGEIADYLDPPEPPETVESLRAERDAAQADVTYWREQFRLVCDESACRLGDRNVARDKLERAECVIHSHSDALNAMRTERDEALLANERFEGEQEELVQTLNILSAANYTIARLRATHVEAEAAWARCKRQPRVWKAGDPEPVGVSRVQDDDGDQWVNTGNGWVMSGDGRTWRRVAMRYAPLTEVLNED